MLVLFNTLIGSGWVPILHKTMSIFAKGGAGWVCLYWLTFVSLAHMIIINLLSALLLDIYSHELKQQHHDKELKGMLIAHLFPKQKGAYQLGEQSGEGKERTNSGKLAARRNSFATIEAKSMLMLSNGVRRVFDQFATSSLPPNNHQRSSRNLLMEAAGLDAGGTTPDSSGHKALSVDNFAAFLLSLGEALPFKKVARVVNDLDVHGTGRVEFDEFIIWWRDHAVDKIFDAFDTDKSGGIELGEMPKLLEFVGIDLATADSEKIAAYLSKLAPGGPAGKGGGRRGEGNVLEDNGDGDQGDCNTLKNNKVVLPSLKGATGGNSDRSVDSGSGASGSGSGGSGDSGSDGSGDSGSGGSSSPIDGQVLTIEQFRRWWRVFDVERSFNHFDIDNSGHINKEELMYLFRELGVTLGASETSRVFKQLDHNGNGISFETFLPWWIQLSDQLSAQQRYKHDEMQLEEQRQLNQGPANTLAQRAAAIDEFVARLGLDASDRSKLLQEYAEPTTPGTAQRATLSHTHTHKGKGARLEATNYAPNAE
jgi:Ca2+-binding EF-hand superfamily protein